MTENPIDSPVSVVAALVGRHAFADQPALANLEFQAGLAGRIGEPFDPAVKLISVAINWRSG